MKKNVCMECRRRIPPKQTLCALCEHHEDMKKKHMRQTALT